MARAQKTLEEERASRTVLENRHKDLDNTTRGLADRLGEAYQELTRMDSELRAKEGLAVRLASAQEDLREAQKARRALEEAAQATLQVDAGATQHDYQERLAAAQRELEAKDALVTSLAAEAEDVRIEAEAQQSQHNCRMQDLHERLREEQERREEVQRCHEDARQQLEERLADIVIRRSTMQEELRTSESEMAAQEIMQRRLLVADEALRTREAAVSSSEGEPQPAAIASAPTAESMDDMSAGENSQHVPAVASRNAGGASSSSAAGASAALLPGDEVAAQAFGPKSRFKKALSVFQYQRVQPESDDKEQLRRARQRQQERVEREELAARRKELEKEALEASALRSNLQEQQRSLQRQLDEALAMEDVLLQSLTIDFPASASSDEPGAATSRRLQEAPESPDDDRPREVTRARVPLLPPTMVASARVQPAQPARGERPRPASSGAGQAQT